MIFGTVLSYHHKTVVQFPPCFRIGPINKPEIKIDAGTMSSFNLSSKTASGEMFFYSLILYETRLNSKFSAILASSRRFHFNVSTSFNVFLSLFYQEHKWKNKSTASFETIGGHPKMHTLITMPARIASVSWLPNYWKCLCPLAALPSIFPRQELRTLYEISRYAISEYHPFRLVF